MFAVIDVTVSAGIVEDAGLTRFFAIIAGLDGEAVGEAAVMAFVIAVVAGFAELDGAVSASGFRLQFDGTAFGPAVTGFDGTRRRAAVAVDFIAIVAGFADVPHTVSAGPFPEGSNAGGVNSSAQPKICMAPIIQAKRT